MAYGAYLPPNAQNSVTPMQCLHDLCQYTKDFPPSPK